MQSAFQWDRNFETGIAKVDEQHHHLVDLINVFSEKVINQGVREEDLVVLFAELTDYTHYHFQEEERYMDKMGVFPAFIDEHKAVHDGFTKQLGLMKGQLKLDSSEDWEVLLNFLYQWLGNHILGQDQSMARQIALIEEGESAEQAYRVELEKSGQDSQAPLLNALHRLVELLADKNLELKDLNLHLEDMVRRRTEELEEANCKLEEISLTDALTGLPNRRHAMQKLERYWNESVENDQPLSCMMIDADYFKEVNDTWGHDAGDKVLCELARTLSHNVRTDDMVCRLGGDEFFVICPNTGLEGCLVLADQILEKVKSLLVSTGDGHWHSSVSIGIAEKAAGMTSREELVKMSDDSVYRAKEAGRGCIRAMQR